MELNKRARAGLSDEGIEVEVFEGFLEGTGRVGGCHLDLDLKRG